MGWVGVGVGWGGWGGTEEGLAFLGFLFFSPLLEMKGGGVRVRRGRKTKDRDREDSKGISRGVTSKEHVLEERNIERKNDGKGRGTFG